jgi:tryptophan synthase alpha subunit
MIGFGIATPSDVDDALTIGDIAVVGSAVIKSVQSGGVSGAIDLIQKLVQS